jgi:hypothetical protein
MLSLAKMEARAYRGPHGSLVGQSQTSGCNEFAVVASTTDVQKVFVAIELSKSTWVVAIQPPAVDK